MSTACTITFYVRDVNTIIVWIGFPDRDIRAIRSVSVRASGAAELEEHILSKVQAGGLIGINLVNRRSDSACLDWEIDYRWVRVLNSLEVLREFRCVVTNLYLFGLWYLRTLVIAKCIASFRTHFSMYNIHRCKWHKPMICCDWTYGSTSLLRSYVLPLKVGVHEILANSENPTKEQSKITTATRYVPPILLW